MKKLFTTLAIAGAAALIVSTPVRAEDADASAAASSKIELKDGTWVEVKGGNAFVIGQDGKATPAADGTWEAKDGQKIVTKGGKVVE